MKALEQYLNDHLSGSAAAISLLRTMAKSDPQDCVFYLCLREEITANRMLLLKLIRAQGLRPARWLELVGKGTSFLGKFRLRWQGLSTGKLGLLEALELLELGIHGQLLLWITLKNGTPLVLPDSDYDWDSLIVSAETLKAKVEARRLLAAKRVFTGAAAA